jgi:3-oxoacyl-[acyl-carrier-protein] synthase II
MRPSSTKVVVVGAGFVLPGARTKQEFWSLARSGKTATAMIDRFPVATYTGKRAGIVADEQLDLFPARMRKRMDRFCQLSMVATHDALRSAGLTDGVPAERTGIYVGNMFGGWEITEPSLRNLCQVGYIGVSPYIATAWFPTAPQGQISIHWNVKGYNKTVSADTASAAVAIGYAARAIAEGRADIMITGGAEAPVTPYTYTFCETSGRLTPGDYAPFTDTARGFHVGEGAVMFVLESESSANARGARVLAEVAGFATGHARSREVFDRPGSTTLAQIGRAALHDAGLAASDLDYVALDAQGKVDADSSEADAMTELLAEAGGDVPCSTAKPTVGHLLGAAPAVEMLATVLAMEHSEIPPIAGIDCGNHDLDLVVGDPRPQDIQAALVMARGADGTVAALALTAA